MHQRPPIDVCPSQLGSPHREDVANVVPVLTALRANRPAQLGDDHVLGRRHEGVVREHPGGLTASEALLVVCIVAQHEQLTHERTSRQRDEVAHSARHRCERALVLEHQPVGQVRLEPLKAAGCQLDDEIGVARRPGNAVEVRGQRPNEHVGHGCRVERGTHRHYGLIRRHGVSSDWTRARCASTRARTSRSSRSG